MNEKTLKETAEVAVPKTSALLADVTERVRYYARRSGADMLELGKALTEAKELVPHGEFESWVRENAGLEKRAAQYFMKAYRKWGTGNPGVEGLNVGQMIALLPATAEQEEKIAAENDVKGMSSREIREAVKKAREEERKIAMESIEAERENLKIQLGKVREQAEKEKETAVRQAQEQAGAYPEMKEELERNRQEISRLIEANKAMLENARAWNREKAEMQAEIDENNEIIREQQGELNEAKNDLLNLKSAQRRGAEPESDGMTLDTFSRATREFMGWVSIIPQMRTTFAGMDDPERRKWREQAETVRAWAEDTLKALDCLNAAEGGYSIE